MPALFRACTCFDHRPFYSIRLVIAPFSPDRGPGSPGLDGVPFNPALSLQSCLSLLDRLLDQQVAAALYIVLGRVLG